MAVITVVVTALAVALALAYNRRVWRPRQRGGGEHSDGLNIPDEAMPLVTLSAVLLVFVLVQVFSSWSAAGRAETTEATATATLLLFREAFVARDGERAQARQERLGEARPTVPTALSLLMLLAVVGTLVIVGVATAAVVPPGAHAAIVITSAVVFGATRLLIRDFDQPYTGLTGRDPTQTTFVRDLLASEVRDPLPCDERGLPTGVPGFRATTSPLR